MKKLEINAVDIEISGELSTRYLYSDSKDLFDKNNLRFKEIEVRGEANQLEDINNINIDDIYIEYAGVGYFLKGGMIKAYEFQINSNSTNPYYISMSVIGSDLIPAIIEVKFKDKCKEVKYKDYKLVTEKYGKLGSMTYNEFKDKIMVEKI